ncbi:hypothetical protein QBC38DRAFT_549676 [Podospora fimiseda]|uniref:NmrA-like domain-containing protein n=1 Tax=Podospora fimiseda TaxID=252190 RepID=A0AAN6YNR3_9PEZI|nr:hypothetical protein QBC38DRAFT_549676 [Podospora fimiseda]
MSPKIITIVGATGFQGRGVLTSFINNPSYQIRAITRTPSSSSAQSLLSLDPNITLVKADITDLLALKLAFSGSNIIFAVTDFLAPMLAHNFDGAKAEGIETQQGINLALAAASTLDTLDHYIWSTLPDASGISGGKNPVPHMDGKASVDAYIRKSLPELLTKTTFLYVGVYSQAFTYPVLQPYLISTANKYLQFGYWAPDTPVFIIGNVSKNIGPFVKAAVEQGDKTRNGGVVLAVLPGKEGVIKAEELMKVWARAKGVEGMYVRVKDWEYKSLWPGWGEEVGSMFELWDLVRERSWTRVDDEGGKVLTAGDLGLSEGDFEGLEESFRGLVMPWEV